MSTKKRITTLEQQLGSLLRNAPSFDAARQALKSGNLSAYLRASRSHSVALDKQSRQANGIISQANKAIDAGNAALLRSVKKLTGLRK